MLNIMLNKEGYITNDATIVYKEAMRLIRNKEKVLRKKRRNLYRFIINNKTISKPDLGMSFI